ncbi:MAG TPA: hypothetical protein VMU14_04650, partial [Acidimicrobiales bacterium]|nr:hypothetical protein [Acidimicrobiales bacterium]
MIAGVTVHVNPNLPWYIARAGGIVAWALIAATVIWGLAFSGKLTRHPKLPSPAWMLDLHRFLGGLAVIFTGLHIAGLMLDKFVGYGPFNVLVPFTGAYRPVATAWGIVAIYLLVSVELTSLVMTRLPREVWHGIHLSSYVIFALATIHGLTTGTDARHGILPLAMVLTAIVVAMLTGMRAQIGIAKRTERAMRAQRGGRAVPSRGAEGAAADRPARERPVRSRPERSPVAEPAAVADDLPEVPERPVRRRELPERPAPTPLLEPAVAEEHALPSGLAQEPRHARHLGLPEPALAEAGARTAPIPPARTAAPVPPRQPVPAAAAAAAAALPGPSGPPPVGPAPRPPAYGDPSVPPARYEPGYPAAPFAEPRVPAPGDPRYADPRYGYGDPRLAHPRLADPRYGDPRAADPRNADPRYAGPRYADARPAGP